MSETFKMSIAGCADCICRKCLKYVSGRCPHGGCYDNFRAASMPYDKAHPNDPPRKGWSNWKEDQAYWCRGGIFYPTSECKEFVRYEGSKVQSCLKANVTIYQDGFIGCSLIENFGCEKCYEEFESALEKKEK